MATDLTLNYAKVAPLNVWNSFTCLYYMYYAVLTFDPLNALSSILTYKHGYRQNGLGEDNQQT